MTGQITARSLFMRRFGPGLVDLRKAAGMTQVVFAAATGTSQPTLSRIERGMSLPDVLLLKRMSLALGITVEQFYNRIGC